MSSHCLSVAKTFWAVLRARVMLTLLLFYLIGLYITTSSDSVAIGPAFIGFVVLAMWYVNGVCLNDIADKEVDSINLRNVPSRPLQSGNGTILRLWMIAVIVAVIAIVLAWYINPWLTLVVSLGLLLNWLYSMPPIHVSYRGVLAPIMLPIGYVILPLIIGIVAYGSNNQISLKLWQILLILSLYIGFSGRIILKDFRDVKGDKKVGKLTYLLRHGRKSTCYYAMVATVISLVLIILTKQALLILFSMLFYVFALYLLWRLIPAQSRIEEHLTIAAIARSANGVVIVVLLYLISLRQTKPHIIVIVALSIVSLLIVQSVMQAWSDRKKITILKYY